MSDCNDGAQTQYYTMVSLTLRIVWKHPKSATLLEKKHHQVHVTRACLPLTLLFNIWLRRVSSTPTYLHLTSPDPPHIWQMRFFVYPTQYTVAVRTKFCRTICKGQEERKNSWTRKRPRIKWHEQEREQQTLKPPLLEFERNYVGLDSWQDSNREVTSSLETTSSIQTKISTTSDSKIWHRS